MKCLKYRDNLGLGKRNKGVSVKYSYKLVIELGTEVPLNTREAPVEMLILNRTRELF